MWNGDETIASFMYDTPERRGRGVSKQAAPRTSLGGVMVTAPGPGDAIRVRKVKPPGREEMPVRIRPQARKSLPRGEAQHRQGQTQSLAKHRYKVMAKSQENQTPQVRPPQETKLALWEQFREVPATACRQIQAGNLKGKTDINPVWRMKVLTEMFGPVGFGWNVKEVERWTNECAGEVGAFVKVELRVNWAGTWSEPIEGTGGSKLCGKGRGEGINDEAWKMATTDAISVACKSLGIAADIYFAADAQWGSKYETRETAQSGPRNAPAGNYTTQPRQGRRTGRNEPNPGEYGPGPVYASNGQPYQGQQLPRNPSKVCEVVDVQKGRARRLIAELAKYDYEDPDSWAAGLAWLRNEVVLREGAEAAIVQLAIEARNNAQQQAVNQVFQK